MENRFASEGSEGSKKGRDTYVPNQTIYQNASAERVSADALSLLGAAPGAEG